MQCFFPRLATDRRCGMKQIKEMIRFQWRLEEVACLQMTNGPGLYLSGSVAFNIQSGSFQFAFNKMRHTRLFLLFLHAPFLLIGVQGAGQGNGFKPIVHFFKKKLRTGADPLAHSFPSDPMNCLLWKFSTQRLKVIMWPIAGRTFLPMDPGKDHLLQRSRILQ